MADKGSGLDYRDSRIADLAQAARHIDDASSRTGSPEPERSTLAPLRLARRVRSRGRLAVLLVVTVVYAGATFETERRQVYAVEAAVRAVVGEARVVSMERGSRPCGRYRLPGEPALRFVSAGGVVAVETIDGRWLTKGGQVLAEDAYHRCVAQPSRHPAVERLVDAPVAGLALLMPR